MGLSVPIYVYFGCFKKGYMTGRYVAREGLFSKEEYANVLILPCIVSNTFIYKE